MAASSPKDAWAARADFGFPALTEHWDGTAWQIVPTPVGGGVNAVSVGPEGTIWAVRALPDLRS
ncbi:MAG TPA: hypothetical protein VGM14_03095 [Streptosporangiaceae bacterium]